MQTGFRKLKNKLYSKVKLTKPLLHQILDEQRKVTNALLDLKSDNPILDKSDSTDESSKANYFCRICFSN